MQNPNAKFNDTSFPSKILTYLTNGLRVVSINIPAIEQSKIGKYIYFYHNQNSKEISKIIKKINLQDKLNIDKGIKQLNESTEKEFKKFIEVRGK